MVSLSNEKDQNRVGILLFRLHWKRYSPPFPDQRSSNLSNFSSKSISIAKTPMKNARHSIDSGISSQLLMLNYILSILMCIVKPAIIYLHSSGLFYTLLRSCVCRSTDWCMPSRWPIENTRINRYDSSQTPKISRGNQNVSGKCHKCAYWIAPMCILHSIYSYCSFFLVFSQEVYYYPVAIIVASVVGSVEFKIYAVFTVKIAASDSIFHSSVRLSSGIQGIIYCKWYLLPLSDQKAFILLSNVAKVTNSLNVADMMRLNVNTYLIVSCHPLECSHLSFFFSPFQMINRIYSFAMVLHNSI